MDRHIQEKAKKFAEKCDSIEFCQTDRAYSAAEIMKRSRRRDYGLLLSLCGVMVCNQLGLGLAQAVCHGLTNVFAGNLQRHSLTNQTAF